MLDEEITLLKLEENRDEDGYDIPTVTESVVFAEIQDPFRNEFYEAMKAGVKLETTFKVATDDYKNQQQVRYNGTVLDIVRSHPIDRIYTRLICKEVT